MILRAGVLMTLLLNALHAQQPPSVIDAVSKSHAVGREADGVAAVLEALAAGGDVNERDKTGWTPLMFASLECRAEVVNLLLNRGADVTLQADGGRKTNFMDHGQTVLTIGSSCFIARRRATVARERGMPKSSARKELEAPLEIVRNLIRHGASVNGTDADGRTPLMMAVMHNWQDVAKELVAAAASVKQRDGEGRTLTDYADPKAIGIQQLLISAHAPKPSGRSGRTVCDAQIIGHADRRLHLGTTVQ
jgi:ankyrin repeat protein